MSLDFGIYENGVIEYGGCFDEKELPLKNLFKSVITEQKTKEFAMNFFKYKENELQWYLTAIASLTLLDLV